jgi:hypothetical protein
MVRPSYETIETLQDELTLIEKICHQWRCEAAKLPIKYLLDFALVREGEIIAWCEIKRRTYSFEDLDKMGGYMLALTKWQMACVLNKLSQRPFVLVVQCTDGIRAAVWETGNMPFLKPSIAGRYDRGDWQDAEPCIFIPVSEFKKVIT